MTRRAALGAVLGAALVVPLASASEETFPGKPGKLVFQSNRTGNYELYVANASGSGGKLLLSRPKTDEFNASWSPSGGEVVFQTGPADSSDFDLWIVGANGKDAYTILGGKTNDRAPQFCDFRTVVFTRQLSPTSSDVYSIDLGTRRVRRLTNDPSTDSFPTCHPKRNEIAFISARDGGIPRIYVMTRTGANQRPLVAAPSLDPDYSTDGTALAYIAPDADRSLEVFTMNLATRAVKQRTNVKAPLEHRLPKFVPAATRSASARSGPDDKVVATQRDTSSTPASESIVEVLPDGTDRLLPEPGSGGSVQPLAAADCNCTGLEVEVERARLFDAGKGLSLNLAWTITCTRGNGGCAGLMRVVPPRKYEGLDRELATYKCVGNCGTSTTVRLREFTYETKAPKAASGGIVFRIMFACGAKRYERVYRLHFREDGKILDREKSDLNGNRVPDGKEREK